MHTLQLLIVLTTYITLIVSEDFCPQRKYDQLILVDNSANMTVKNPNNYDIIKQYLQNYVAKFTVGPGSTRFGVIQFSDTAELEWDLESPEANDLASLQAAIGNMPYANGSRCTRCALEAALPILQNQHRPTIAPTVLLLTDGVNNVGNSPTAAAAALRNAGVDIFVIGLSSEADINELTDISGGTFFRGSLSISDDYSEVLNQQHLDYITCAAVFNVPEPDEIWYCPSDAAKCYRTFVTGEPTTFLNAEAVCTNLNGHLVTINSDAENTYILSLLPLEAVNYAWLGAYRENPSQNWKWKDETPFGYNNWNTGEPSAGTENCVELYLNFARGPRGKWNNIDCSTGEVKNFVCQIGDATCGLQGYHNIAHMTNTIAAVDWALDQGANGIQLDLQFDSSGNVVNFKHGSPCDCDCLCLLPSLLQNPCAANSPTSVCAALGGSDPCNAATDAGDLLEYAATKTSLATIVINSHISSSSSNQSMRAAAANSAVQLIMDHLFGAGYRGKVILSVPKLSAFDYLTTAAGLFNTHSPFNQSVHYSVHGEGNDIVDTLEAELTLPTDNLVYITGRPACNADILGLSAITKQTKQLAAYNRIQGVVGLAILYTVDANIDISDSFKYFDGVVTNFPGRASALVAARGARLALPCFVVTEGSIVQDASDHLCEACISIPASISSSIVDSTSGFQCACSYQPYGLLGLNGGCKISTAAPDHTGCYCTKNTLLIPYSCSGDVVMCKDAATAKCLSPDTSEEACEQGGGNCVGYSIPG